MSMYTQHLGIALEERAHFSIRPTTGDAFAELLRCRRRLSAGISLSREPDRALGAVSEQLAYDVALIEFAEGLGIGCDPLRFGRPQGERHAIEQALISRGIPLYDLDQRS
jgi:hypothetical protein